MSRPLLTTTSGLFLNAMKGQRVVKISDQRLDRLGLLLFPGLTKHQETLAGFAFIRGLPNPSSRAQQSGTKLLSGLAVQFCGNPNSGRNIA
jgi:hypothetical protein